MARKRYKPEEIVSLFRQAEVLHGQGMSMADAIRQLGISEVAFYRWRKEYAGMSGDQLRRLKEFVLAIAQKRAYLLLWGCLDQVSRPALANTCRAPSKLAGSLVAFAAESNASCIGRASSAHTKLCESRLEQVPCRIGLAIISLRT